MTTEATRYEGGLDWMRSYFGDAIPPRTATEASLAAMNDLGRQSIEHSYDTWSRPGMDQKTKSLITLTITAALGVTEMFRMHLRGAHNIGVPRDLIAELLVHIGVYCGTPRASVASRIARNLWRELDEQAADQQER